MDSEPGQCPDIKGTETCRAIASVRCGVFVISTATQTIGRLCASHDESGFSLVRCISSNEPRVELTETLQFMAYDVHDLIFTWNMVPDAIHNHELVKIELMQTVQKVRHLVLVPFGDLPSMLQVFFQNWCRHFYTLAGFYTQVNIDGKAEYVNNSMHVMSFYNTQRQTQTIDFVYDYTHLIDDMIYVATKFKSETQVVGTPLEYELQVTDFTVPDNVLPEGPFKEASFGENDFGDPCVTLGPISPASSDQWTTPL